MNKNKGYTFINILGLAVGLSAVILLLLLIQFEISFDKFHDKADRIFQIYRSGEGYSRFVTLTPAPLAPAMEKDFPEVLVATRFRPTSNVHISYDRKNFFEKGFVFADPSMFKMFSFELLKGDPNTSLIEPYSVIISESMVEKYFNDEEPIGKTISYRETYNFKVTGVLKNIPQNSNFDIDFIAPFTTLQKMDSFYNLSNWLANSHFTYVLLRENTSTKNLENKFPEFLRSYLEKEEASKVQLSFMPLTKIHLQSDRIKLIYIITSVAFLILLIACMNYINLATARAAQRMREIGIRKAIGANKSQLIKQFLGESIIHTLFAFLLAICLVSILILSFNSFVERDLNFNLLENRQFLAWLVVLITGVGLFAGGYPAFTISAFKPSSILMKKFTVAKDSVFRNILVIVQFSISVILIVAFLIINQQMNFIRNRDLGFQKNQVVVVDIRDNKIRQNMDAIQNVLKTNPNIVTVAPSRFLPNETGASTLADWSGKLADKKQEIYVNFVDYDFVELYGIDIIEGRNFSTEFPSDASGAFLLNESAVKAIGWKSPIGKELTHFVSEKTGQVIGVVKDFHMLSLHHNIEPLCLDLDNSRANTYLSIKIKGNNIPDTISHIRETLAKFSPQYPFKYNFFDEIFDSQYQLELKTEKIFSLFAVLAIFIACLGLFGLASFSSIQRTKEIGIRKVLGASISGVVILLSKQFCKWVLIANIVALPIAYFSMNRWLQNFAYRTNIGISTFVLAMVIAFAVALITVSYQSVKAALANPVESLRYE